MARSPFSCDQRLGHYRLRERLGTGGMGEVWRAFDLQLEREIAIKLVHADLGRDREWLDRLHTEARVAASLDHPNVVTIHSVEEAEGVCFFTMELVRGRTLQEVIPQSGLSPESFLEIATPLTDGIWAAHRAGLIHRDLKPANVMIRDDGAVKILDFGLAQTLGRPARDLSEITTWKSSIETGLLGTIPYMSPEQLRNETLDVRSDIFSLGSMLYQMATGRPPFIGVTAADTIAAILRDSPKLSEELNPELPSAIWHLIRACLAKDRDRRFQSVDSIHIQLSTLAKEVEGKDDPAVAVLPFVDLSPEEDQAYFCEGVAEEIINALVKVGSLRVPPRADSFRLAGRNLAHSEIGRELDVGYVLEGSVRKATDRLRVTVKLDDVSRGRTVWSENFDRQVHDVFVIQDEIARNVVRALKLRLEPSSEPLTGLRPTADMAAYDYYLRGRSFYFQYSNRAMQFALDMFRQAITLDPDFALAYSGSADCYAFLYLYFERSEKNRSCVDDCSSRALALEPELAEAHASRGLALSIAGDAPGAEKAFETAIRLNGRLFSAYFYYARHCFTAGQLEKAVWLYEEASRVCPSDYQSPLLVAQIYESMGRFSEAEAVRQRGLEAAERHLSLHPDDSRAWYMSANALVGIGRVEQGLRWADRAMEIDPDEAMLLYNLGCIKSMAGRFDDALNHLEEAVRRGLSQREWYEHDSNLDPLRELPRFQQLIAKMPAAEQETHS